MGNLYREQNIRENFVEAFGDNMTPRQLWAIVKFSKYCRTYARNNAAFNNLANRVFPGAQFRQVQKTTRDGRSYPGLQITLRGEVAEDTGADTDDE